MASRTGPTGSRPVRSISTRSTGGTPTILTRTRSASGGTRSSSRTPKAAAKEPEQPGQDATLRAPEQRRTTVRHLRYAGRQGRRRGQRGGGGRVLARDGQGAQARRSGRAAWHLLALSAPRSWRRRSRERTGVRDRAAPAGECRLTPAGKPPRPWRSGPCSVRSMPTTPTSPTCWALRTPRTRRPPGRATARPPLPRTSSLQPPSRTRTTVQRAANSRTGNADHPRPVIGEPCPRHDFNPTLTPSYMDDFMIEKLGHRACGTLAFPCKKIVQRFAPGFRK